MGLKLEKLVTFRTNMTYVYSIPLRYFGRYIYTDIFYHCAKQALETTTTAIFFRTKENQSFNLIYHKLVDKYTIDYVPLVDARKFF